MAGIIGAFAGWLGGLSLPAVACDLSPPETGTVAAVLDGETLKLTDGRTVRLIGAKVPTPPLGWRGDDPWPLVDEAKQALSALASGHAVELRFGGRRQDRHGYFLAHVFVVEGEHHLWLQEQLLAKGLARVYSFADNRACVAELLAREGRARAKRLGLWASYVYRIEPSLDVERLGRLIHSYQLVEGTVVAVGEGGGRLYLNFTNDWRSDFTVSIDRKDASAFAAAGIDLKTLAGRRLRAHGFFAWRNGPMIEATHPEQIELLLENPGEENTKPPERPTGPAIAL
jgi:endonuclease YncB( thermonuclease family)